MSTATGLAMNTTTTPNCLRSNRVPTSPGQQVAQVDSEALPQTTTTRPLRPPTYPPPAFRNGFAPAGQRPDRRPQGPRFVRRMSELIDPSFVAQTDAVVQSPSGSLLNHADFANREDRPLSLRERQEKIRKEMNRKTCLATTQNADVDKEDGTSSKAFDSPKSTYTEDFDSRSDESRGGYTSRKWRWLCCGGQREC